MLRRVYTEESEGLTCMTLSKHESAELLLHATENNDFQN